MTGDYLKIKLNMNLTFYISFTHSGIISNGEGDEDFEDWQKSEKCHNPLHVSRARGPRVTFIDEKNNTLSNQIVLGPSKIYKCGGIGAARPSALRSNQWYS